MELLELLELLEPLGAAYITSVMSTCLFYHGRQCQSNTTSKTLIVDVYFSTVIIVDDVPSNISST